MPHQNSIEQQIIALQMNCYVIKSEMDKFMKFLQKWKLRKALNIQLVRTLGHLLSTSAM